MKRVNRRLYLIRSRRVEGKRCVQHRSPLLDFCLIPTRTILFLQQHKFAGGVKPRLTPGIVQQHQRQQAMYLGASRQQVTRTRPRRIASPHSSCRVSESPLVAT